MTSLVTGSLGFLGWNLTKRLSQVEAVTGLDNALRTHGRPDEEGAGPGYQPLIMDVRDAALLGHVGGSRAVWHLAAVNGTRRFYEIPDVVLDTQILGTVNVIRACEAAGVTRLVLFSSSEVYQDAQQVPTPESVPLSIPDVTNPRYSYAISKIAAEALAWHSKIPQVVVIRPHNVYGPYMGDAHVIPELVDQFAHLPRTGGKVVVSSDAEATRSFIHVDDFVDACLTIADSLPSEGGAREIFHVGSGIETRIDDVVAMLTRLTGTSPRIERRSAPAGSPLRRCPDVSRLHSLGWAPRVTLEAGLRSLIANAEDRLGALT